MKKLDVKTLLELSRLSMDQLEKYMDHDNYKLRGAEVLIINNNLESSAVLLHGILYYAIESNKSLNMKPGKLDLSRRLGLKPTTIRLAGLDKDKKHILVSPNRKEPVKFDLSKRDRILIINDFRTNTPKYVVYKD